MAKPGTATPARIGARPRAVGMWAGVAAIRPGWAVFRGTAGDAAPHRHHALQIALGLGDPVELRMPRRRALIGPGVVVAADHVHRLVSRPAPLALLYVEPESAAGRLLERWCSGGARPLSGAQHRSLVSLLPAIATEIENGLADPLRRALLGTSEIEGEERPMDERIERSLAGLPRPLPSRIALADLAARAELSPSRYAHLFRAEVGLPLRPYLRWRRLREALTEIARGRTLTSAALAAGFSDSAHLSRTFRRTFGIPPRRVLDPGLVLEAPDGGGG